MAVSLWSWLRRYISRTPTCLTIVVGLLLAGYQQWVGPLSLTTELVFCIGLLLATGIPHGALDHLVEQERSLRQSQPFSLPRFMVRYVVLIALYGLGWVLFPVLSLILFLLISAWHFGETDLEHAPDNSYWSLTRLVAGSFVLAFLLLVHAQEATPIIARIVQNDKLTLQLWQMAVSQTGAILRGWLTLLFVLSMLAFGHRPMAINGWRLVRLALVLALTYTLPLLPAFMLYFGGWHSLSSFGSIQTYLQKSQSNQPSPWKIWWQSVPLTLLAVGFLLAGAGVWYSYTPSMDPLPYLFILLSTITLPHIQVMHQLNMVSK
jgi:Brp/Blh family beta-carotene 15,15'-monooxygenase